MNSKRIFLYSKIIIIDLIFSLFHVCSDSGPESFFFLLNCVIIFVFRKPNYNILNNKQKRELFMTRQIFLHFICTRIFSTCGSVLKSSQYLELLKISLISFAEMYKLYSPGCVYI